MIDANVNQIEGARLPEIAVPLEREMVAFDALPPALRARMASMSVKWNAEGVAHLRQRHGDAYTLAILDKVEGDMQTAYVGRLP